MVHRKACRSVFPASVSVCTCVCLGPPHVYPTPQCQQFASPACPFYSIMLAHACPARTPLQTFPSNYVSHKGGWEEVIEPVSSCDQDSLDPSTQQTAVSIAENGSAGADPNAAEVFCHIIDAGASTYDPPAMPPDVAELAGLFHARPEIWWVTCRLHDLNRYVTHHCFPSPCSARAAVQHACVIGCMQRCWHSLPHEAHAMPCTLITLLHESACMTH